MPTLEGLSTLVTGGGRGIGRAIALRFAREAADVFVVDIDEANARGVADEVRALGRRAEAMRVDVRDPEQSRVMIDRAVERFGRLDVLVNNAGVVRVSSLLDVTPEEWDFVLDVNTKGLFFALQAGARQMMSQEPMRQGGLRGKIINTASIAGRIGRPMFAPYAASKSAVISITKSAAQALAPHVTVNAMCPGVVDTDMWRQIDQELTELEGQPLGTAWRERISGIPMVRPELPEDVAGLAAFLAGPDSDYFTGQSIHVDGGLVML